MKTLSQHLPQLVVAVSVIAASVFLATMNVIDGTTAVAMIMVVSGFSLGGVVASPSITGIEMVGPIEAQPVCPFASTGINRIGTWAMEQTPIAATNEKSNP